MTLFFRSAPLLLAALLAGTSALAQSVTPIGAIQGSGAAATAGTYTVEGIVTGVYAALSPAGFYLQNDAAGADGNPATSDALFVVQAAPAVAAGDRVRISGTVLESSAAPSFNQAVLTAPAITPVSTGQALPAFAALSNAAFSVAQAEPYEGMLVEFSAPLTVTDVENLRTFGELTLSTQGIIYQPTQLVDPNDDPAAGTTSAGAGNVPAVTAFQAANANRTVLLDDGSTARTPAPTPYLDPATRTVRVGSTVAGVRGVLGYAFSRWRVQPLPGAPAPVPTVVRPPVPTFGPLDVKLASFNVLNYFNGDGAGGGFPTARGARTAADFARQRSKIIAALVQMNADVLGLIEIENDGTGAASALQDLLNGLNQAAGAGTYALVNDGAAAQPNNTDLIRCAILYKPAAVTPRGNVLVAAATGVFERPPLAQLFVTNRAGAPDTFALVVNHFKSKAGGGSATGANADQGDGQAAFNPRRRDQALALVTFINAVVRPAGTRYVVSVGDYNAYYEEDPMDLLRAAGLVVSGPASSTSYVFDGQSGSLDHAVLSPNLVGRAAVAKWAINASEPVFLEYSVAGAATDVTSPFRSSDHDPILVGLNFAGVITATARPASGVQLQAYPNPAPGAFNVRIVGLPGAQPLALEVSSLLGQRVLALRGPAEGLQAELGRRTACLAPGTYLLRLSGAGFNQVQRVVKL